MKSLVKSFVILCIFLLTIMPSAAGDLLLRGKQISISDGLPSNTVNWMVQDRDGYIWIASANGLSRYDGYSFLNYNPLPISPTQMVSGHIDFMISDTKNNLIWAFTQQHDMICYNLSKSRFVDFSTYITKMPNFYYKMLTQDGLWVWDDEVGARKISYNGNDFTIKDFSKRNHLLPTDKIRSVAEDDRHNMWLNTDWGLVMIDKHNKVHLEFRKSNLVKMSKNRLPFVNTPNLKFTQNTKGFDFAADNMGNLHIVTPEGKKKILHLLDDKSIINGRTANFTMDVDSKKHRIYIATYGNGLFVYNYIDDTLLHYTAEDDQPIIKTDFLLNILLDRSGCLWICSAMGVFKIVEENDINVSFVYPQPEIKGEWNNYVRKLFSLDNGKILASTKECNLFEYSPDNGSIKKTVSSEACVYAYLKDRDGHMWTGTKGAGFMVDGKKYKYNDAIHNIPINEIFDILQDKYGRIWIATWDGGLLQTKYESGKPMIFRQYLTKSYGERRLHDLTIDYDGRLWIATNSGLYMVDTNKKRITNADINRYNVSNGKFPFDEILSLSLTSKGELLAGGLGGMTICKIEGNYLKYDFKSQANGLINNNVRSMVEDDDGNIWVATEEGMSRINRQYQDIKNYTLSDELRSNIYTEGSVVKLKDGRLMFGTNRGITIITPKNIHASSADNMRIRFTDIFVNGASVYNNTEDIKITPSLNNIKKISVAYDQRRISVYFSNFDYNNQSAILYQYYLEDIDKSWRETTNVNHADFGDLVPGAYRLHVRALTPGGRWTEENTLDIIIRQPLYNTIWAWMVYLTFIGMVAYYLYRFWHRNFELQQEMKVNKTLTDFRINFFTHVSHEFRTPLAIIQSAIAKLTVNGQTGVSRATMQSLKRGTSRMLKLVNQLMEFRKLSTGNMPLELEKEDIIFFIRNIYQDFWALAQQKDISYNIRTFAKSYNLAFDRHKVEMILSNIISNAVKYTPIRGNILLEVKQKKEGLENIVVTITDDGPGITKEQQRYMFTEFMNGNVSTGGMGIGLYMAYRMANIHKGSLTYKRINDEGGSVFTITLPADESVYTEDEYKKETAINESGISEEEHLQLLRELQTNPINDITIEIIEDDADMLEQIKEELSVYFKVDAFMDGKSGLENIMQKHPQLVISDIMLPDMTGFDILAKVKQNSIVASIPFIILTALDDDSKRLKSIKQGADDYMVKPCNPTLLVARVLQLIKQKKEIEPAAKENKEIETDKETEILVSVSDKYFSDRLKVIVNNHISDPNFNIDRLSELMNMSRTKIYYMMKRVTGQTPNDYIQNERLKTASEMILEGGLTISEISIKVGFQSSAYFTRCFKNKFGVTPGKYCG